MFPRSLQICYFYLYKLYNLLTQTIIYTNIININNSSILLYLNTIFRQYYKTDNAILSIARPNLVLVPTLDKICRCFQINCLHHFVTNLNLNIRNKINTNNRIKTQS